MSSRVSGPGTRGDEVAESDAHPRHVPGEMAREERDDPCADARVAVTPLQAAVVRVVRDAPDAAQRLVDDALGGARTVLGDRAHRAPQPVELGERGLAVRTAALVVVDRVGPALGHLVHERFGIAPARQAGPAARLRGACGRCREGRAVVGHDQSFISAISVARARANRPRTVASDTFVTAAACR